MNASGRRPMITRPTSGTSSKKGLTPNSRPIVYPEDAYGFAKTGQTIFSVTDSKTIKLFVDDEPFWLPNANLLSYDRRLNMRSGTLDREIVWETPTGKQVSITSRRL